MEEIAQVYARALFEVAKDRGELDDTREQIGQFADALNESADLRTFFFSPYFSSQEKKEGLHKAIDGASATVMNTLEALIEKHRMPAMFRIRRAFEKLYERENQQLPVEVTAAIELDPQIVAQIGETIGKQTGQKVKLESRVDPDILGGIVLRVGNVIMDASIRNRLDQVRKHVARA